MRTYESALLSLRQKQSRSEVTRKSLQLLISPHLTSVKSRAMRTSFSTTESTNPIESWLASWVMWLTLGQVPEGCVDSLLSRIHGVGEEHFPKGKSAVISRRWARTSGQTKTKWCSPHMTREIWAPLEGNRNKQDSTHFSSALTYFKYLTILVII